MFFRQLTTEEAAKFRQWARDNYKPGSDISALWHPVVLAECVKIAAEHAVFVPEVAADA